MKIGSVTFVLFGALLFVGAGCLNNDDRENTTVSLPRPEEPKEAPWLDVQSSNKEDLARGNFMLEAIPIEFTCGETDCSIPMVSMRWAGLASDSICIWGAAGGNAQVPFFEVTKDGMHNVTINSPGFTWIEDVLCKNLDGKIFYGTTETKIVPSG